MENKEQVQKTAEELRQESENRGELQRLVGLFKDVAEELAKDAEWYEAHNASGLSEICRYCERGVLDIIELVQSECDTLDDVDELLDSFKRDAAAVAVRQRVYSDGNNDRSVANSILRGKL